MASDLERALERAMATELSVTVLESLDRRVLSALDSAAGDNAPRPRPHRRLLAAFGIAALLAGIAASPAIREYFDGWTGGTFESIWDRATEVDQAVVDQGYRVSLVRAYADPSGLRLALAVEDLRGRGWEEITVGMPRVTDEHGREYQPFMGEFGAQTSTLSEAIMVYLVAPEHAEPGARHLTATVDFLGVRRAAAPMESIPPEDLHERVAGRWAFEFDLDFFGAVTAAPDVTAHAAGIDVALRRLSVTPSSTIGLLEIQGLPVVELGWDPYISVRRNGRQLDLWRLSPGFVGDRMEFEIQEGFEDLSARWTITIAEFHRDIPDPNSDITTEEESIVGPWVLEFEGPAASS